MSDTHAENKRCDFCDELIRVAAVVCPFCQRELSGKNRGEVRVADRSTRLGIAVLMTIVLIQLIYVLAKVT